MKIVRDIAYKESLLGDFYLPEGAVPEGGFPAALLIHGGGWTGMDRFAVRGIADFLAENGFAVFNIDYRLAPQHRWPAGCEDCKDAAKWLLETDYPVNRNKLFSVGASSGGHYALMTGLMLKHTFCGIVSISGIDDVFPDLESTPGRYTLLLGASPTKEALREINPATYLTSDAPPVLCTHWRKDPVVPFAACAEFEKAVLKNGTRICVYSYDFARQCEGHDIWIPGSSPHKLYPDLEAVISCFMKEIISE